MGEVTKYMHAFDQTIGGEETTLEMYCVWEDNFKMELKKTVCALHLFCVGIA
jgi:hypothetical protein